jgi:pimeloyl-ACP methyl ester carboxylesterase
MLCGGRIAALEWGPADGDLVLCWHGAGGSSRDFELVGPDIAARLGSRVVAVDAPGHGRSPSLQADSFRPSALAGLAARVLDELGGSQATFIGFSWGGSVGCRLAASFPDRLRALVLVEGGHLDFADLPGFRAGRSLGALVEEARATAAAEGEAFGTHTPETAGAMVHGLCAEPVAETWPHLAESGLPVLFIGTSGGAGLGFDPVARLRERIPQTTVVELRHGHGLLRDDPRAIADTACAWLASL